MVQKKAPFSGTFSPLVNNGDCVRFRQPIGTILFGDLYNQLANAAGEIQGILTPQDVIAGVVLCEIDDKSVKCQAAIDDLISKTLTRRISRKPKKKAAKKTAKKTAKKAAKKSTKKTVGKKAKPASKKAPKKIAKKTVRKPAKKSFKKSAIETVKKPVVMRRTRRPKNQPGRKNNIMDKLKREQFFKRIGLLAAGYLLVPGISSARSFLQGVSKDAQSGLENSVKDDMNDCAIIDLHCHPSLKMYLLSKKMWKAHLMKNPGPNLIHMQDDTKDLGAGNVKGMVATHYLPEIGIRKNWQTVKFLWPAIRYLLFSTSEKVEHGDYSNFTQINTMIDTLEYQLYIVNEKFAAKKEPNFKYMIARNFTEFEKGLDPSNKPRTIPVAHAIEGAHALGRNFYPEEQAKQAHVSKSIISAKRPHEGKMHNNNDDNPDFYIMNLRALKERGVCMMTLGHFFENDLAYPVDGMSPDSKNSNRHDMEL